MLSIFFFEHTHTENKNGFQQLCVSVVQCVKMSFDTIDERILRQSKPIFVRNLFPSASRTSHYDRFIPQRANNNWETNFATIPDQNRNQTPNGKKTNGNSRENGENTRDNSVYNILLRNEILGETIEDIKSQCDERQALTPVKSRNLFKYGTPSKVKNKFVFVKVGPNFANG